MQMPAPDASILARKEQIVARLREVLPASAVISDLSETRAYECDALTAYRCPPLCAVLPASTEEVSAVLKICHEEGVPSTGCFAPSGGCSCTLAALAT